MKIKTIYVLMMIFVIAGLMRFVFIKYSPGYEWDEPVYTVIAERINTTGYPNLKGENNTYHNEPYLYHPPFDFYLKAGWFWILGEATIFNARLLSAVQGMFTLIVGYFCLKDISTTRGALLGTFFLAIDGWLVFTNRLNLLENGMMLIGILGIWMYIRATKSRKTITYLIAGVLLAFAAVYKHTGVVFLFVPVLNFVVDKEDKKDHLIIVLTMFLVVVTYIATMSLISGEYFRFQTWVQIRRALGNIESRGLNYGIREAISAILNIYWVFIPTILIILGTGILASFRIFQSIFRRKKIENSVFLSWVIISYMFLGVIALRAPHYLIIIIIPNILFLSSELDNLFEKVNNNGRRLKQLSTLERHKIMTEGERKEFVKLLGTNKRRFKQLKTLVKHRVIKDIESKELSVLVRCKTNKTRRFKKNLLMIFLSLILLLNFLTWNERLGKEYDNALSLTYNYFSTVSLEARVLADECIGVYIDQPYYSIDRHTSEEAIRYVDPDYIVTYVSETQKLPDSLPLLNLIESSVLIRRFQGFKETIEIYKVFSD